MTTTQDTGHAARQVRAAVRRTQHLAHAAIDALDPPLAIAYCRSLRSMLWRAQNQKIDLTESAAHDDGAEWDQGAGEGCAAAIQKRCASFQH